MGASLRLIVINWLCLIRRFKDKSFRSGRVARSGLPYDSRQSDALQHIVQIESAKVISLLSERF